jgi:hypothetical protein
MVFVVGARRSGTNWLQRALGAHPAVACVPGETYLFYGGIRPLAERIQHGAAGSARTGSVYMARDAFLDATRDFCDRVFGGLLDSVAGEARYLVERTPWHVLCLDLIGDVYPDAPVIHIVRDGRDVARSLLAQPWGPETIEDAAREWQESVIAGHAAAPRLARYHEVRYEELLADPCRVIEELYAFLELPRTQAVVDAAVAEAAIPYNLVAGESDVGAEKWRSALTASQLSAFMAVAGDKLSSLGYEAIATSAPETRDRRSVVMALRGRVRGRLRRHGSGRREERALRQRLDASQEVVEQLLECVERPDLETLERVLTPRVSVRIIDHEGEWQARGETGVGRLFDVLRADAAGAMQQQVRGDLHPGVPTWTIVLEHASPGGTTVRRVVVASATNARRIDEVTYYRAGVAGAQVV